MRPVKRTHTLVPTAVLRALIATVIQKQPWKDRSNVMIAQLVGRRKKAVPNASLAVRAHSAKVVNIAQWVLLVKEKMMQPNANNAIQVLQPRQRVQPSAVGVILEHTAVPLACVLNVQKILL